MKNLLSCILNSVSITNSTENSILCSQVDIRIQDEDLRTRKFFHPVSYSRVIRECEGRMVEEYIPYLQVECRQMVKEENREGSLVEVSLF